MAGFRWSPTRRPVAASFTTTGGDGAEKLPRMSRARGIAGALSRVLLPLTRAIPASVSLKHRCIGPRWAAAHLSRSCICFRFFVCFVPPVGVITVSYVFGEPHAPRTAELAKLRVPPGSIWAGPVVGCWFFCFLFRFIFSIFVFFLFFCFFFFLLFRFSVSVYFFVFLFTFIFSFFCLSFFFLLLCIFTFFPFLMFIFYFLFCLLSFLVLY